jgi:hypothetical protein
MQHLGVKLWKFCKLQGNTWGTCDDGSQQTGCGPQEHFINCADVSIVPSGHKFKNSLWLDPEMTSSSRANPHMMYYKDFSQEGAPLTPLIITYVHNCMHHII